MKAIHSIKFPLSLIILLLSFTLPAQEDTVKMTNVKMWRILKEDVKDLKGQMGNWQFMMRERPIMIITDVGANRMRIMSPVVEETQLKLEHYKTMMEANFDRALDAKYATYNKIVWTVFTHPLEELTTSQFRDALEQVVKLAENFGGSYTSTDFVFGGG